jgi:hypothetical protein
MSTSQRFAATQKLRPPPENKNEILKPEKLSVGDCIGFSTGGRTIGGDACGIRYGDLLPRN